MKHFYRMVLLLLAAAGTSQAQDFRPFRTGLTYQFSETTTSGDTTHALGLLGPGSRVGADSVFRFNGMASNTGTSSSVCFSRQIMRRENLFGATLTVAANSSFVLTAANGRALTLRPRAALNQPWLALAPAVTGTVQSRSAATVLGQVDSVATIALSTGQVFRVSKRFGLVAGPAVLALLDGRYRTRQLTLTALPELRLGTNRLGPQGTYDFQPGDVFLRYYTYHPDAGMLCEEAWQRDSIVSRVSRANGDSISYRIQTQSLQRAYGSAGAPFGFCRTPQGTVLSPPATSTMAVGLDGPGAYSLIRLSNAASPAAQGGQGSVVILSMPGARGVRFNGRYEQGLVNRALCGPLTADSVGLRPVIDHGSQIRYGQGLGLTFAAHQEYGGARITQLMGYRKGAETWGQLTTFAQLLPAATARPAATTAAWPSPFGSELSVTFQLARPQPVALELRDALGRLVLARPLASQPAGGSTVPLATAGVPAGFYTVHLLLPQEKRTEVLKVLKAH